MTDSGREKGRRLLSALSAQVKKSGLGPGADLAAHQRGLKALAELAEDLTGPDAPPGLMLWRDSEDKVRVTRTQKQGELTIRWDRPAQALTVVGDKGGARVSDARYCFHESNNSWRRMDGASELYEDVTLLLVEVLYPDARPR